MSLATIRAYSDPRRAPTVRPGPVARAAEANELRRQIMKVGEGVRVGIAHLADLKRQLTALDEAQAEREWSAAE